MYHVKRVETTPSCFLESPVLPGGVTCVNAELTPRNGRRDAVRDEYHLGCTIEP